MLITHIVIGTIRVTKRRNKLVHKPRCETRLLKPKTQTAATSKQVYKL